MRCQQRRKQLLELVRLRRFASLPELVEELGVSESTIRRDLDYLEELGSARRTHGGVLYAGDLPKFPHFEMRQPADWPKKRAIAQRTAELIADGESILLDGGSTTYEVARLLVGRPIHVVTNSLPVANLLAADTRADLVLVGGNVCPRTGVVLGPYADRMLASIRVRKAILSVAAINEEGYFNNNLLLVETERAMMRAASEVIVVADSSKFGHQSLAHLCRLGEVNYLVVDSQIDPQWREKVLAAGVKLLVAQSSV
jgi:DeoR family fructose operon transcriptional repressor